MISCSADGTGLGHKGTGEGTVCQQGPAPPPCPGCAAHLSQWLTQFTQDAFLIKHLALVAVFIVVMDALPGVRWELVERHILLHLFILRWGRETGVTSWHPRLVTRGILQP